MKRICQILLFAISVSASGQARQDDNTDNLYLIIDTTSNERYGYVNTRGDTVIPFNKYRICYTDTFRIMAIVLKEKAGFVGIDRNENVLFEIFPYDNGPDEPSDGLFRIIENGKIGFADLNGNIVIKPQYGCAFPFENGLAKVSKDCRSIKDGEHTAWTSENWYFIDQKGNSVEY
jgi:hypothetical protein